MDTVTKKDSIHLGRKVSRMRELLGVKQETLATELGITQQAVSKLEQSEKIDDDRLEQVAKILGVNVDVIKNFNEDKMHSSICNTFNNYDSASQSFQEGAIQNNINPIEKILELSDKNAALYERLLQSERDKVAYLEKLLEGKNPKS